MRDVLNGRPTQRCSERGSARLCAWLGIARVQRWMEIRGTLAGRSRTFWRFCQNNVRAVWFRSHFLWERLSGAYHGRGKSDLLPIDKSRNRYVFKPRGRRISRDELQKVFDSLPAAARADWLSESFALACWVVKVYLGKDWFDRYVTPKGKKRSIFTIEETPGDAQELSFYRIIDLSEVLYNLQDISGFDECLERLRKGEIEGVFAELDLGRMLFGNQIEFKFVRPSGKRGADYDVELVYNNIVICGDAKCKIESTSFSHTTVDATLEKARRQLPNDRPGIVFVKIPPAWFTDRSVEHELADIAMDFLRTTRRVVSVKYYTPWIAFRSRGVLVVEHRFKELSNPKTDFGDNLDLGHFSDENSARMEG